MLDDWGRQLQNAGTQIGVEGLLRSSGAYQPNDAQRYNQLSAFVQRSLDEELERAYTENDRLRKEIKTLKEQMSLMGCLMCDGSERISVPKQEWEDYRDFVRLFKLANSFIKIVRRAAK